MHVMICIFLINIQNEVATLSHAAFTPTTENLDSLVESGTTSASNDGPILSEGGDSDDLVIQLCQILCTLKEIFLKASREDQKLLADQVKLGPDALGVFYGLSFHLFESKTKCSYSVDYNSLFMI